MRKVTKTLLFLTLTLIFTLSLISVACGAQPSGGGASTVTVTATKTATATVTAAAPTKPVKVYRMEPATWIAAGSPWDFLNYQAEYLNKLSDGRIEDTPSAPGAVCPVEEQIETAAAGTTLAMLATPSYYPGKVPLAALYNTGIGLPSWQDMKVAYENFQDGAAQKLYFDALEKFANIKVVGTRYGEVDCIISSKKAIPDLAALKGMKFRCGDEHFAAAFTALGASTVWFPGTEIYTGLATGVVDAFTYGSAYDHLGLGVQEVTKFWVDAKALTRANNEQFVINLDTWNEMGADLQNLLYASVESADWRSATESVLSINNAWQTAEAAGVQRTYWSDADNKNYTQKMAEWAKKYTDQYPEDAQFMQIIQQYDDFMGY
jgi:TRAP-type C4-dicarboxylate transport system substrate-binding protein